MHADRPRNESTLPGANERFEGPANGDAVAARPLGRGIRRVLSATLVVILLAAGGLGLHGLIKTRDALSSITQTPLSLLDALNFILGRADHREPAAAAHGFGLFDVARGIDDAFWIALFDEADVSAAAEGDGLSPLAKAPAHFDPDRINILVLGMRGAEDPRGGLLSDAIVVVSIHERMDRVALLSIPRDLFVNLPGSDRYHRINAAHAIGQAQGGRGLELAKATVSAAAGIPVHHAVSVDFGAFTEVVDILGGIEVRVRRPFEGTEREALVVAPGMVRMDGETALTYATSRRTTDDFDRSRRQREVIDAIVARAQDKSLHLQPRKLLDILESLGRHVRTTMAASDITHLLGLADSLDLDGLIEVGFDASSSSPLVATRASNGAYILVPRDGTFEGFQRSFQDVFVAGGSNQGRDEVRSITDD